MKILRRVPYWYLVAIPILLVLLGAASNQAVLVANWGKFPVMVNEFQTAEMRDVQKRACSPQEQREEFSSFDTEVSPACTALKDNGQFVDEIHSFMGHNSRLKFLADYINLKDKIASPGDLLIALGSWLWSFTPIMWLGLVLRKFLAS